MIIALAQIQSKKGDIPFNIKKHESFISKAAAEKANLIIFPELSIMNYEPDLAEQLATKEDDPRFQTFQQLANKENITIGIGVPLQQEVGVHISLLFFQPQKKLKIYSKQLLHADEVPFFKSGNHQVYLEFDSHKIAPAICYESLQEHHVKNAFENDSNIYLASVAKPQRGIEKAYIHYPKIAKKYEMLVLMANSIGPSDNFTAAGQSGIWNTDGRLLSQLPKDKEGLLIINTYTLATTSTS